LEQAAIVNLFQKYINNECSPDEVDQLMEFLEEHGNEALIQELINTQLAAGTESPGYTDALLQQQLENQLQVILQRINQPQPAKVRPLRWIKIAAAAVVILSMGGAVWWLNRSPKVETAKQTSKPGKDILPGGNNAVLTLANGSTIVLNDAANGQLAREGNVQVTKQRNGQLVYKVIATANAPITYNTLSTPKGGQYQLVLPDGSQVWLNAASSVRFPTSFSGTERIVTITGEAYFEVVHNNKKPFIVELPPNGNVAGGRVEVLGTHFNVNAYDDESSIRTTLLEGSVKVSSGPSYAKAPAGEAIGNNTVILKPGEQVSISQTSELSQPIPAQTDEVMAWKNGLFQFENTDIKTIMRQLCRWYNVEVEYKTTTLQNEPLFIEISRNKNLSDVLKLISLTSGVQVKLEGKKIIVL
jgi:transmembrane sensor